MRGLENTSVNDSEDRDNRPKVGSGLDERARHGAPRRRTGGCDGRRDVDGWRVRYGSQSVLSTRLLRRANSASSRRLETPVLSKMLVR